MSKSRAWTKKRRFWSRTKFGVLLLLILVGVLVRAHSLAPRLAAEAGRDTNDRVAVGKLQTALAFSPGNDTVRLVLAQRYIKLGRTDAALDTLRGGHAVATLDLLARTQLSRGEYTACIQTSQRLGNPVLLNDGAQCQIEAGEYQAALASAQRAIQLDSANPDYRLSAIWSQLLQNNDAAVITRSISGLSDFKATERAKRASASKLALAQELYASGLVNASGKVLTSLPDTAEQQLLLAQIELAKPHRDLAAVRTRLELALRLDQVNLPARRLLIDTLKQMGEASAAQTQQDRLNQLTNGRI